MLYYRELPMFLTSKIIALSSVVAGAGSALLLQALSATAGEHGAPLVWTLAAGVFGAGATWGLTKAELKRALAAANRAHHRVDEEKEDREKAIAALTKQMETGFTEVNENVRTVLRMLGGGN